MGDGESIPLLKDEPDTYRVFNMKSRQIKKITFEDFRNNYPGYPEDSCFTINENGIDMAVFVGLPVEGGIISFDRIRDTIWQVFKANDLLYSDVPYKSRKGRRESVIRLAYIHYLLLGYKGDDNYNYIIKLLSGAIPAANTIDKVKRLIDKDRANDSLNGSNKVLDFFGEQISAIHFALILNGNKYTTQFAHYLSYRLLTQLSPEEICKIIGCPSAIEALRRMENL